MNGDTVCLQGTTPSEFSYTMVELSALGEDNTEVGERDPEIAILLEKFAPVFHTPEGMPPTRQYDHVIPLVQGAQPFSTRPYHFAPELKSEIE